MPGFDPAAQIQTMAPTLDPAVQAQPMADTPALRRADPDVKSRTLVSAEIPGYRIEFRRVKKTNELLVNGYVYAEHVAAVEFGHTLSATVGGHTVLAAFDGVVTCSIAVDGQVIAAKKRWY